ncbi:hypothetical protein BJX99DRAFT_256754 [Aspergillus californicus]
MPVLKVVVAVCCGQNNRASYAVFVQFINPDEIARRRNGIRVHGDVTHLHPGGFGNEWWTEIHQCIMDELQAAFGHDWEYIANLEYRYTVLGRLYNEVSSSVHIADVHLDPYYDLWYNIVDEQQASAALTERLAVANMEVESMEDGTLAIERHEGEFAAHYAPGQADIVRELALRTTLIQDPRARLIFPGSNLRK